MGRKKRKCEKGKTNKNEEMGGRRESVRMGKRIKKEERQYEEGRGTEDEGECAKKRKKIKGRRNIEREEERRKQGRQGGKRG